MENNLQVQFEVYLLRYRKHRYKKGVAERDYDGIRSLAGNDVKYEHLISKELKKLGDAKTDMFISMSNLADFISKYADHIRFVE